MVFSVQHQREMNQAIDTDLNLAVILLMTEGGGMGVGQDVLGIEEAEIIRRRKRCVSFCVHVISTEIVALLVEFCR